MLLLHLKINNKHGEDKPSVTHLHSPGGCSVNMQHSFLCFTGKETEARGRPPFSGLAGSPLFRIMILTGGKMGFNETEHFAEKSACPSVCVLSRSVSRV